MVSSKEIIQRAYREDRRFLLEPEAKELIGLYGIPVPRYRVAEDREEVVSLAGEIGYPVVIKIVSPDILHKSDVGGVIVGVRDGQEALEAFDKIMGNVKKAKGKPDIRGVLVEEMAKPGVEVVVGSTTDPQFGPAIMFGLGGVFIEVLEDVAFRIVPIERRDAEEMLQEIKGRKLLEGFRGMAPRDKETLVKIILSVSDMLMENGEISQLDLNPIVSYEKGALTLDARIILK